MRSLSFVFIAFLASTLPACGGCGDDTTAEPDAEQAPDAEVPDATPDLPPGPVTNLTATGAAPGVDLAWTNPTDADLAGVLVVVSSTPITFDPTDGTTYTAAQDLGTGQTVLSVASGTSASLAAAIIGARYYFSVWAFDDTTQYSTAATVTGQQNALGAQTATISISLAGVVTVTSAPANFTLTGTAVYTDAANTLDVDLTVQNDTARLVFNLKALNTAQNEGAEAGTTFPLTGGQPSTYYGPEALDVGASATRTLNLTGITGASDPITVNLTFVDAPMIYTARRSASTSAADSTGSGEGATVDLNLANNDILLGAAVSPDGKFVYAGSKQEPSVTVLDTRTLTAVLGTTIGDEVSGLGCVAGVGMSQDGSRLFALLNDGTHWQGGDNTSGGPGSVNTEVQLVELAASDLSETARITLHTADTAFRVGREIRVSADGHTAAVVVAAAAGGANELWLIDLDSLTAIDADAATAGTQPVTLSAEGAAAHATWSGSTVYVGFYHHNQHVTVDGPLPIDVVNTTTFAVTQIAAITGANDNASPMATHGSKLYYPSRTFQDGAGTTGLFVVDGTTATEVVTGLLNSVGVLFAPDGGRYYVFGDADDVVVVDAATDTAIDTDGDGTNGATGFALAGSAKAHFFAITPF